MVDRIPLGALFNSPEVERLCSYSNSRRLANGYKELYRKLAATIYNGNVRGQEWCTIFTPKTINSHFRSKIGIKTRNYRKIIKMNWHGKHFIAFQFNSIQFCKKIIELNCISKKKIWHRIDSVNLMHDPELPKVTSLGGPTLRKKILTELNFGYITELALPQLPCQVTCRAQTPHHTPTKSGASTDVRDEERGTSCLVIKCCFCNTE